MPALLQVVGEFNCDEIHIGECDAERVKMPQKQLAKWMTFIHVEAL